jgi:hypothetical protein
METLLAEWRPQVRASEGQLEIPLLTEALREASDFSDDAPPPIPTGMPREVFQAHLAVAAEKVMLALYRDLSSDLNDKMAEEMRRLIDQAISRAVKSLRQQILVSVAESLTHSIENLGRADPGRPEDSHSKSKP